MSAQTNDHLLSPSKMSAQTNDHLPSPILDLLAAASKMCVEIIPIETNSQDSINHLIKFIISSNPDQTDPFYVLDLGTATNIYHNWTQHLPFIQPFFAVKSNPDPALLGTLAALGASFDCASRAEIESVLSLGVSPDRIVYANPCKAEPHIDFARTVNVNLTTFDSVHELLKMSQHHPQCSLLLRIKPPVSTGVRRSLGSKYGALPEEVGPLLEAVRSMDLSVIGVSFHIGTSATIFDTYDAAIQAAREVFDVAEKMSLPSMSVLNIGGGFTAGPLLEEAAKAIKCSIISRFGDWAGLRVIAEPGRCFSQTAATLATRVIGKRVRGAKKEYWLNDGIYGSMCCIKMDAVNVSIVPLEQRPEGTETYASTVFGPTCDALDVIASEVELPELEVGEWMVSPAMGAYAKTMGSSFNGFSTPDLRVYLANSVTRE